LNDMPPNERAEVLPQIWSTLDTWPDHLRLWDNRWENLLDCKGIFKVFAQDWDFDVADAISSGMKRNGADEVWVGAWLYSLSWMVWEVISIAISGSQDRIWLLKSGRFNESSDEDYEALFEIDIATGVGDCLMVWRRPPGTKAVVPAFLIEIRHGQVAVGFWNRCDMVQGAFQVQVFQGTDTLFVHSEQGQSTERKEMLRHQIELFGALDAEEQALWMFAYPGTVYRLDLGTFQLVQRHGFGPSISDLVAGNGGVYLVYASNWIQFINQRLESLVPESNLQEKLLFFTEIVGFDPSVADDGSPVLGMFLEVALGNTSQLEDSTVGPTVHYRLKGYDDPLFTFQRLATTRGWQVTFLSPPDFMRLVACGPPFKQESALELKSFLREGDLAAIGFAPEAKSVFFATSAGMWEWHWMDEQPVMR
jgi:hypothetical protein